MNARLCLFCLFCLVFSSIDNRAQDVHLSQFEASPLFLNPALGGQYHGDWRVGNSVREQWRSIETPYQSYVLFFDRHFYYYSKQINGGAVYVHDRSGDSKLTAEKIYFSMSYPLTEGKSQLSAGIQPGIVMKSYNDNLTFPGQYDHSIGYFNPDLPNQETSNYGNTRKAYFDVNAGLYWRLNLPKIKPSVGISLLHINQPDESFNDNGSKMPIRENIHANAFIWMKNKFYLKPAFSFSSQNKANQLVMGSDFGKVFKGKGKTIKELFAGLYIRNGYNRNNDAIIPVVGIQYLNWRIGMNYDVNTSDLKEASNNRGAFELSVIYTAPSTSPNHTAIPCDRY